MKGWLRLAIPALTRIFQECDNGVIYRCLHNKKTTFFFKKWLKVDLFGEIHYG